MPKFIIYDTRAFIIEAEDEDAAFEAYCQLSDDESRQIEVEGGGIEVNCLH